MSEPKNKKAELEAAQVAVPEIPAVVKTKVITQPQATQSEAPPPAKPEVKSKDFQFFKNPTLSNESYLGSNGEYTGNSLRAGVDVAKTPYGSINAKYLLNTNKENELSKSLRITNASPSLKLGNIGNTIFTGGAQNWTNYNFDTQKTTNTARLSLNATQKNIGLQEYLVGKASWDAKMKSDPEFKGFTLGVQKNLTMFGKPVYAYGEGYLPPETLNGNFKKTTYAIGFGLKL